MTQSQDAALDSFFSTALPPFKYMVTLRISRLVIIPCEALQVLIGKLIISTEN